MKIPLVSTSMKTASPSRWTGRAARALLCALPIYAAMLFTVAEASAWPLDPATEAANLERARVRRLGNIVGLSLMGFLIVIPLSVALIRHRRNARTEWSVEDANLADAE
jgi:hypothetical protein